MHVIIVGGGGFIGLKLARRLAERGEIRGRPIERMTLADLGAPDPIEAPFEVRGAVVDVGERASVDALFAPEDGPPADVIFHLAAVVSAHAEEDFDAGMRVNLHGTLNVLEAARAPGTAPVVVYASTLAVFGGDVPDPVEDWTIPLPQTSYGAQKAAGELMLNDYARRGFVDGRGFRLPTIAVRPGRPNRAASSFMSSIIREPLAGEPAVCPVDPEFLHYYLSPRRCVENLIRGAEVEAEAMGATRCLTMPGHTASIREMVDAMTAVAGPEPARLIEWREEPAIARIVRGWRHDYRPAKALSLGLSADAGFEDNVRIYLEDDAPGAPRAA